MFFRQTVKLWVIVSALATLAGWTLSALGMLTRPGYLIFGVALVVLALPGWRWVSSFVTGFALNSTLKKLRRRFRRFLPAGFAMLAALVFISGLIYAPTDHTAMSYRLPRVMEWLSHGRWFWIHTRNYRMNDRACGIEWLSAPLLLFTKSDRALFLLNFIPFLLLPGLIFSVWTRLGVRPRVAWSWMWLVPTGYCFLLQAGGAANDAFPTVYVLAMMDFALLARDQALTDRRIPTLNVSSNIAFSLLSAALLVGAKASNLPLGLPWAIIFFPLLPQLWRALNATRNTQHTTRYAFHIFACAFVIPVALTISFIPTALLNARHLHDWSGLSIEHAGMNMKNPVAGILGNAVLLFTNNFVPTFFPLAGWWNQHALSHFPSGLVRLMDANFEGGYNILGEMPTEDWAGIGFGVSMLVVVSIVAGLWYRNSSRALPLCNNSAIHQSIFWRRVTLIAPWIALLAYCMNTGMVTPARLITPYYPLLLPALLIGAGQSGVVRRRWWQVAAGFVLLLALAALIVTPPRPLWPGRQILARAIAAHPNQRQLQRAQKVYDVYAHRSDPLAGMRQWFPDDLKVIGFMGTDDDLDISLWKPYFSRRVERFLFDDSPERIREMGIQYGVVSGLELDVNKSTIQDWLQKSGAELLETTNATMTVSQGPEPWYFVRFKP